jgi:sarcosine oxidase
MKAIVVGLGIMGSAAAYHLARRGCEVIALDANARGHALGSSHGRTRIVRQAYFEAPEYVPLLKRAYDLWHELEKESGRKLLELCGGLFIGDSAHATLVEDAKHSADLHAIPYELLTGAEIRKRFPCFNIPDSYCAVYEPGAGLCYADECLAAHDDMAQKHGAQLRFNEPVVSWHATAGGVTVKTPAAEYHGDILVITAGPWAPNVLSELSLPLHVLRVFFSYFETRQPEKFMPDRCPIYCISEEGCFYYGFPFEQGGGMKIAHHGSARFSVQHAGNQICTPETADRIVHEHEVELMRSKLDECLPGAAGNCVSSTVCLYTMTPDEQFIIEPHAQHKNVVYGCGFSGHGFKFGSVVGELLADLATKGKTDLNIDFLSSKRFAAKAAL